MTLARAAKRSQHRKLEKNNNGVRAWVVSFFPLGYFRFVKMRPPTIFRNPLTVSLFAVLIFCGLALGEGVGIGISLTGNQHAGLAYAGRPVAARRAPTKMRAAKRKAFSKRTRPRRLRGIRARAGSPTRARQISRARGTRLGRLVQQSQRVRPSRR